MSLSTEIVPTGLSRTSYPTNIPHEESPNGHQMQSYKQGIQILNTHHHESVATRECMQVEITRLHASLDYYKQQLRVSEITRKRLYEDNIRIYAERNHFKDQINMFNSYHQEFEVIRKRTQDENVQLYTELERYKRQSETYECHYRESEIAKKQIQDENFQLHTEAGYFKRRTTKSSELTSCSGCGRDDLNPAELKTRQDTDCCVTEWDFKFLYTQVVARVPRDKVGSYLLEFDRTYKLSPTVDPQHRKDPMRFLENAGIDVVHWTAIAWIRWYGTIHPRLLALLDAYFNFGLRPPFQWEYDTSGRKPMQDLP